MADRIGSTSPGIILALALRKDLNLYASGLRRSQRSFAAGGN